MNPSVEAAYIGGGAAILVVLVTALIAIRQLQHDRDQRAADRALQAKRELLVDALKGAIVLSSLPSQLTRAEVDVEQVGAKFVESHSRISASSAVASLEVIERGSALVDLAGRAFTTAMTVRALLGRDPQQTQMKEFIVNILEGQKQYQELLSPFIAAIRRDLMIEGSDDAEVQKALHIDVDSALQHAKRMLDRLGSDGTVK